MKVTLIMLVYKTERYVEKALRSALEQTLPQMELVIVNDATPDGSMAVVERVLRDYPNRAGQVKIINQPTNQGSAAARQTGIDNAAGDYTIFLDSDDWIEPQMAEKMYARAMETGADIVACDAFFDWPHKCVYVAQPAPATGRDYASALLRGDLHGWSCNKLVRRSLYTDNGVAFVPHVDVWEDLIVMIQLAWFAGTVSYLSEAFLHYWQGNAGSLVQSKSSKGIQNRQQAVELMERFVGEHMPGHEEDMLQRKLLARYECIHRTRGAQQREMARLYPEIPRRRILTQPRAALRHRAAHFLACCGMPWVGNAMAWAISAYKGASSTVK